MVTVDSARTFACPPPLPSATLPQVDQPMARLESNGYRLKDHEKERSLFLMSHGDVGYPQFRVGTQYPRFDDLGMLRLPTFSTRTGSFANVLCVNMLLVQCPPPAPP